MCIVYECYSKIVFEMQAHHRTIVNIDSIKMENTCAWNALMAYIILYAKLALSMTSNCPKVFGSYLVEHDMHNNTIALCVCLYIIGHFKPTCS